MTPEANELVQVATSFESAATQMSQALTEFKTDTQRARRIQRLLIAAVILDFVVTLTVAITLTISLGSNSTIRLIKSCTQPTGKCFKDEQAQSSKAIGSLVTQIEAVAYCGFQHPKATLTEIEVCVQDQLKALTH